MEEAGKIFGEEIQQMPPLRQVGRLSAQVRAMPHMFQGIGFEGRDPRHNKSKLVKIQKE